MITTIYGKRNKKRRKHMDIIDTFKHDNYQTEPAKNAIHFVMVNYAVSVRYHSPDALDMDRKEKHKIIAGFDTKEEAERFLMNNYKKIEKDFSQTENFSSYSKKLTFMDAGILFDREQEIEYIYNEEIDYDKIRKDLAEEIEECEIPLQTAAEGASVEAESLRRLPDLSIKDDFAEEESQDDQYIVDDDELEL